MSKKLKNLFQSLEKLYKEKNKDLPFHGWHHIIFVRKKSLEFAEELKADASIVEAAALTHDLNYMIEKNSDANAGIELRKRYLRESGFDEEEILKINEVIDEEEITRRDEAISKEAMALSDADTLFKALPITPIMFSSSYLMENDVDLKDLANKVVRDQEPLLNKGIYFYSESAKKLYSKWARTNVDLMKNIIDALEDKDIVKLIDDAKHK